MTSRRQFIFSSLAALTLPRWGLGQETQHLTKAFSFILLGDLHLDQLAHHDMDWLRREKAGDVRQVENYSRITAEITPKLFDEVRAQIAASLTEVPFVLQIGDFVEGLCGNESLARRHCEDALAMVESANLGAPLLCIKGNHDITGPGAETAYDQLLRPANRHAAIELADDACYVIRHGGTMFCCFDAYKPSSLPWLEKALRTRTSADRVVFFVIHPPVVPYSARCWHVYNTPQEAEQRARLLELLAAENAIVLNGHLHKFGLLGRRVGAKSIRQLSVISVLPETDPKVRDETTTYGPTMTDLEPNFSPLTLEQRKKTLSEESAFVTDYRYANLPGYAIVHVTPSGVSADIYRGLGRSKYATLMLA